MSKLETLMLEDNTLSGEIPSWLFEIESLKNIYIGRNKMIWKNSVKINPKCMLSQISLRSCKIEGDISGWISTRKDLDILDLSNHQLTGRFPQWLAGMDVGSLLLSDKNLTASTSFSNQSDLRILDLSSNNLDGSIPSERANLNGMIRSDIVISMGMGTDNIMQVSVSLLCLFAELFFDSAVFLSLGSCFVLFLLVDKFRWSIKLALGSKNKLGFLDGKVKKPQADDAKYPLWIRNDYMIRGWLCRSMNEKIANSFTYIDSVERLWNELKERYAETNAPLLYSLKKQVKNLEQENMNVSEYYFKLK
ncbi:LRR receptor-like serine/threonine-protein kinase RGI1 [Daucus carota subsp. sativus]|uniref:LRR receptor-like serine/threonine-protein kinase RGI1 n=1 Tax=Daucus carota subsp. sativus TaxID=79200 RepID=UPI00308375A8